jgi:valyl-tRNA synthetase
MRRVPEVLDCWFESGSMPFAQVHYPFENREWFEHHYPGDFIVEYIGQTRGWFYTMHVLATALFDRPAFRNCVSHGILLGADGRKMSKSLRNGIDLTDGDDVIAAKIRAARTDSDPRITFDPQGRPEVATLLQVGALCTDRTPEQLAGEVRGGASALKALVIESVVQFLQPVRRRRAEFSTADARQILSLGVDRAADIAEATLAEVRDAMQMTYGPRVSLPTAAGG